MVSMENKVRYFKTRDEAWTFMRACDDAGVPAGFPSLTDNDGEGYAVQYIDCEHDFSTAEPGCSRCGEPRPVEA
jgi:hypothetical protein